MENSKGKKIKKIFTYFLGFYFLVFGALMSCGEVMAAGIGESCVTAVQCGTRGFGENGAKLKCDFQLPFVGKVCMVDLSVGTTTLPKEEYTPVKQVTSTNPLQFTPQIKIPNTDIDGEVPVGGQVGTKMVSTLLPTYIGAFYKYGLTITGLLATVILMAGGIIWLTSAGNDSKIKQAKEMIFGSLAGVLLLFSSYIILETINPDLVKLKPIESQSIDKVTLDIVCCQTTTGASMMDATECHDSGGSRMTGYMAISGTCVKEGCCILKNQNGNYCYNSIKSSCPVWFQGENTSNIFNEKSCSNVGECENNIKNHCEKAEDGDDCYISSNKGYCYNYKCYIGKGQDGEPCGNDNGICKDKAIHGSCISHDWNGRSCVDEPDTFCCKDGKTEYGGGGGKF